MNYLFTAIMTQTVGSLLSTDVGGRIFADEAPEGTQYPYVVFSLISDTPEKTFTEDFEDIILQFSLYSISKGLAEITDMFADLKTLFDEKSFAITGSTLVWMKRVNLVTMIDDITTPEGTIGVRHWAVDYNILTEAS